MFNSSRTSKGFALTELLIAIFLLGVATVAITGLSVVGTRQALESERQTVSLSIVNRFAEEIRSMPYDNVGFVSPAADEPDGVLEQGQTVSQNQQAYSISLRIDLVDDEVNGTLPEGILNEDNADYKRVGITATWQSASGNSREVSVVTFVSPTGALRACTPGTNTCPGTVPAGTGACIENIVCPASGVCPAESMADPYCPTGAAFCSQCYTDAQCSGGEICDQDTQTCVSLPGACRSDTDCVPGQVCTSGLCATACTGDVDCGVGKICNTETGACTADCRTDACLAGCEIGYHCGASTGLCTEGPPPDGDGDGGGGDGSPCESNNDCSVGFLCVDGTCGPDPSVSPSPTPSPTPTGGGGGRGGGSPCGSDSDCPSGYYCSGGSCTGDWCYSPDIPIECPGGSDPGCGATANCLLGGRWVGNPQIPVEGPSGDPACPGTTIQACVVDPPGPIAVWVACPNCPDFPDPEPDPKSCLVAYWKLDEEESSTCPGGGDACDSVDGNHGSWAFGPQPVADTAPLQFENPFALRFNKHEDDVEGEYSDYVTVPSSSSFNFNEEGMTISAWVKLGLLPSEDTSDTSLSAKAQGIVTRWTCGSDAADWQLIVGDDDKLAFTTPSTGVPGDKSHHHRGDTALGNGWQHVAVVFRSGLKQSTLYVNGQPAGSYVHPTTIGNNFLPVRIGSRDCSDWYTFTKDYTKWGDLFMKDGTVDEVRIYNCPLERVKVQELAEGKENVQ